MTEANATFGLPPVEGDARSLSSAAPAAPEGTGEADGHGFPKKYVHLLVFKGQQAHDLNYVPVGVNGYVFKIARGEKVIVPSVVVDGLNDAVEDITTQGDGGLITRPSHRFPFQVIGDATEAEYLAFRAKMRDQGAKAALRV